MRVLILGLLLAGTAWGSDTCQRAVPLDGETLMPMVAQAAEGSWVYWVPVEQSNAVVCFENNGCFGEDWDRPVKSSSGVTYGYMLKPIEITQRGTDTGT